MLFFKMERVAHAFFFSMQVTLVIRIRSDFNGYVFGDFQSVSLQSHTFHGVVGHQTHFAHTQFAQNLRSHAVVALIGVVAQMNVGINRIVSLLLEFISRNLSHKSDAASFLIEIKHNAFAFLVNHLHGLVQLFAAITPAAAENITGNARRVNADQHRLFMVNDIRTGWCRTTPLWGRGLSEKCTGASDRLHDCRARTVIEAIMWHGAAQSDARWSVEKFRTLSKDDRDAVVEFIESI